MINFNIFGIKISVSVGFFGIVTLMLYIDKTGLMLPTAVTVIVHEIGHLIALILFKSKPESIVLKVGTVGISGRFLLSAKKEIIMLFVCFLLNIFLFFVLFCFYFIFENFVLLNFALVMLVTGVFNLLPIIGLDGGEILKIILNMRLKSVSSNLILYLTSSVTVMFILMLGFYVFADTKSNISLILMALYLFLGILLSKKQKNYCKNYQNIVK